MDKDRKSINVRCFRFDPETDSEGRFDEYKVPFQEDSSVLDVLEYIYENLDPSLSFYASCRRGVCGRCGAKVNGKARLSCGAKVTGDLELEPTRRSKVIRDLRINDLKERESEEAD
jgi:succinate dehydrogenase/fumarate reductase iron-sulfur protein